MTLDHIQINVSNIAVSGRFYGEFLTYFSWQTLFKNEGSWWWHNGGKNTFGIEQTADEYRENKFHRKNTGINHIAFRVESKEEVDKFYKEFLMPHKIKSLYKGPKYYPEYHPTYYAVFFEDPDRIKIEVMSIEIA